MTQATDASGQPQRRRRTLRGCESMSGVLLLLACCVLRAEAVPLTGHRGGVRGSARDESSASTLAPPAWLQPVTSPLWPKSACDVCPHVMQAMRKMLPCPGEAPFSMDKNVMRYGQPCAFSGSCDAFGSPAVRSMCRKMLRKFYKDSSGILRKKDMRAKLYDTLVVKPQDANPLEQPEFNFQMDKYVRMSPTGGGHSCHRTLSPKVR
jgi:hypothetical protein